MSTEPVLHSSELSNQIKQYIANCIDGEANNLSQPPCIVKIHSGNPFRISDNHHYVQIKNPSMITSKLKTLNKNMNWNTMPGILLRLKKWKFLSHYDEAQDKLEFDVVVEAVEVLEKREQTHQNIGNITNLFEAGELQNKFQRLKKYYQAEKFERQHPIGIALDLIELERPFSQLDEYDARETYVSAALNKFPSTFSIVNPSFILDEEREIFRSNKKQDRRFNAVAAECLIGSEEEEEIIESTKKRKNQSRKFGSRSEVLSRSKKSTPFKSSVFKHSPIVIEKLTDKKFWEVMKNKPINSLNKRTPQEDDFDEVYNDVEEDNDLEEVKDDYLDSFKLIKVAKALEKARSPFKSAKTSIQKAREPRSLLNKRNTNYEDDFEEEVYKEIYEDEEEDRGDYFKTFKLLKDNRGSRKPRSLKASPFKNTADLTRSDTIFRKPFGKQNYRDDQERISRKEAVNPLNERLKIDLNEFKPINWKMSTSSMF